MAASMRKTVSAVFGGLVLCTGVGFWLMKSTVSFFWETTYPAGSNPITWRSGVALLVLVAVTQGLSFIYFRLLWRSNGISVEP